MQICSSGPAPRAFTATASAAGQKEQKTEQNRENGWLRVRLCLVVPVYIRLYRVLPLLFTEFGGSIRRCFTAGICLRCQ